MPLRSEVCMGTAGCQPPSNSETGQNISSTGPSPQPPALSSMPVPLEQEPGFQVPRGPFQPSASPCTAPEAAQQLPPALRVLRDRDDLPVAVRARSHTDNSARTHACPHETRKFSLAHWPRPCSGCSAPSLGVAGGRQGLQLAPRCTPTPGQGPERGKQGSETRTTCLEGHG